jgi:hypothetical protein
MAATLGFHIILACLGIALPTVVLIAEFIGLRRRDETAMLLARRWSQVMGVLVAVGAVTGTVLSFEMGLLWPGLMPLRGGARAAVRHRGPVLLPRSDLHRELPVRPAPPAGLGARWSGVPIAVRLAIDAPDRRSLIQRPIRAAS